MKEKPTPKTEVAIIIPQELSPVLKDTKIETGKAQQHAIAFAPSMQEYITLSAVINDLDKVNPSEIDAKRAREARLKMVKVRTGAEEIKDLRKEGIKAEGDLIQALFNVVKNSCLVTENEFTEIEKHQERVEAQRQLELAESRMLLLEPFGTDTTYLPLGKITDEQFDKILANEKLLFEAKKAESERIEAARIENERVAEENRKEALRLQAERIEAERLETERVKKELAEKEILLQKEREAAKVEAEKLAKENAKKLAEQQRLAEIERKKQAEVLAKQQEAAKIEREKQLAELAKQQEITRKAQAELQAKKDVEAKVLAEKLAKEKEALAAPDKIKIRAMYEAIKGIVIPDLKSEPGKEIAKLTSIRIKDLLAEIATESKKLL